MAKEQQKSNKLAQMLFSRGFWASRPVCRHFQFRFGIEHAGVKGVCEPGRQQASKP
jgi:hypothetical protein